jgi:hypothetical protein
MLGKKISGLFICFLFFTIIPIFYNLENVYAESPHYEFEGLIFDENERPFEGILVKIENLDTSQEVFRVTDEDGFFYIDFTSEGWEVPFEVNIETLNAFQFGYNDIEIQNGIYEEMNQYIGELEIKPNIS